MVGRETTASIGSDGRGQLRGIPASSLWGKSAENHFVDQSVIRPIVRRAGVIGDAIVVDLRRVRQRNEPWLVRRSKAKPLPNQVGRVFRLRYGKRTRTAAVFQCVCGQHYVAETYRVKTGLTTSCGCSIVRKHIRPRHPVVFRSNERIRTLYLQQMGAAFRDGPLGSDKLAVFACTCGSRSIMRVRHVKAGASQTCGCGQHRVCPRLNLEIKFLRALHACGIMVQLPCLRGKTMNEASLELFKIVGKFRFGKVLGLIDANRGWTTHNVAWITVEEYRKQQSTAIMSQVVLETELMQRRSGLRATTFVRGSTAERMAAILKAAGPCITRFHKLALINPQADWIPGNVCWVGSPEANKLMEVDRQRLRRAEKAIKGNARRVKRWLEYQGEKLSLKALADRIGIKPSVLSKRLTRNGNDVSAAVAAPIAVGRQTK